MSTMRRGMLPAAAVAVVVTMLAGTGLCVAQTNIENTIKQHNADQIVGYIQPVADLFGATMHSGYYHTADIETMGFHLSLDIVAMGGLVKDDQKTYQAKTPEGFTPATFAAPTIFGGKGTEVVDQATSLRYRSSDGALNVKIMPLAVPQLTIGNIYGTQLSIRYVPLPKVEDVPKITLWGIGARHSVSQYLPAVPLDLAVGVNYNSFTFGDLIDFKGVAINAAASKKIAILTVYGGLQWEKSTMNLKYTSTDVTSPLVDISLDGANSFRFTAGVALGLGPVTLFGDANFGSVTALTAGISFGN